MHHFLCTRGIFSRKEPLDKSFSLFCVISVSHKEEEFDSYYYEKLIYFNPVVMLLNTHRC